MHAWGQGEIRQILSRRHGCDPLQTHPLAADGDEKRQPGAETAARVRRRRQARWLGRCLALYNLDDKDPGTLDDTPCGPKEPSPARGLHFRATASVVVWTLDRITLVQCYTYGFSIKTGPTIGAILWDPYIRKATDDEVRIN